MKYKKTIFIICTIFFLGFVKNTTAQTTSSFNYVSDTIQTWVVPSCVNRVTVQLWAGGGGGGNGTHHPSFKVSGGSSAYYEGVLSGLTPGTIFNLYIPSGGKFVTDTIFGAGGPGGWPGGGHGGQGSGVEGGGGGGYAAIQINGTYYVVVGGGGGGGSSNTPPYDTSYGGSGGATTGGNGGNGGVYHGGGDGATISNGGIPGPSIIFCICNDSGTTGKAFAGGNGGNGRPHSVYGGGGAGAGYYGGGGGGNGGSGGGGGSSYPASTFTINGITFTRASNLQGNSGANNADYFAPGFPPDTSIGMGGYYNNGGNGLILITYGGNYAFPVYDSVLSNPVCGICNGKLIVMDSGGFSPYTYSWTPTGQTTATATGLCANNYTVTVTDNCNNTSTTSIVLTATPLPVTAKVTAQVKCNGNCVGSATATVGIGTPPYTYTWAPSGGSKATATGLCAGIYTVTVKDINGCTGTALATITQPTQVIPNIVTLTNPLCNGGTGSITANASGGVSPYTYKWNPGNQTTATATGLKAGVYTLTITDSNACTATIAATITQPTQVTATISATNHVPCNGGVGNATVTAGGGVSPYTYLWNPTAQATATATGLKAGTYSITVTDNNGCTATNVVTITQPTVLAVSTTNTHAYCNLPNGTATANVSGGTGPYTYLWNPSNQTMAIANSLFVGSYTVSVTDNHQCTASTTVTITQPTLVTAKITSTTNITCNNTGTGTATVTGSGGTLPYTYLWKPSNQTNAIATSLFAGSYTVTVTDANGCSATAIATLSQPTQVTATISEPKVICKDSTGILIANPGGGTAPYKYAWSSGATSGIVTITPIATNNYSVIVTDANGCTATAGIALQYGPAFAVEISGKNAVCVGDSTIICANAIGAIDGVIYQWEPENNTNECIHVSPSLASVYTVIVIDGCGSTTTANATVYTEPTPTVNMGVNFSRGCVPFCVQFLNGSSISKGKIAQYVWNFGDGDSTHSQQPVYCYKSSGEYDVTLTVISDSGCSATLRRNSMVSVYGPPKAEFTYSPQSTTIENPKIQFTNKSTDEYGIAYQWWTFGDNSDSASNELNPIHTYRDTGTYCATLVVMNNGGCMDTITNCLIIEPAFKLYIPSAFTPNGDGKDEVFQPVGQYVRTFEMYVFDRWGMEIFHSTNINQGWNGTVNGGSTISQEDVYIYKITVMDSEDTQHSYVGNVTLLK